MLHEESRSPENPPTSETSKEKVVDPIEAAFEEYLKMFESSSGQVFGFPFSCHHFSLSLLLLNIQVPHEEPSTPDQAPTSEPSKGQEVYPVGVTSEELLRTFGSLNTEVCCFLSVVTTFR